MKKKVVLITIISLCLVATVAMASGNMLIESDKVQIEKEFEPEFDRIANYMGYDTEEKFEKFHRMALFMGRYCVDEKSFEYIENMILSGCDVQTTKDIYQFYLTTNEDITIVRQIYDMVWQGEEIANRDIVFENAFNEITNNKCGVLTKEDVWAYMEKGFSVGDIQEANVLSRKGVMKINEILDARLEGVEIEKLREAINNKATKNTAARVLEGKSGEEDYFEAKAKTVNEKLKEKGLWKGKKGRNFDKVVKMAKDKGIDENKLEELLDEGYSELDLINAMRSTDCTKANIDMVTKREAER